MIQIIFILNDGYGPPPGIKDVTHIPHINTYSGFVDNDEQYLALEDSPEIAHISKTQTKVEKKEKKSEDDDKNWFVVQLNKVERTE